VTAFDAVARQTFVAELVSDKNLSNAVALNSTSYQVARMVGPATAGLLIAGLGTGWVFILNAASFAGVLGALLACACTNSTATSARRRSPAISSKGFATSARVRSCSRC
jgi:MFS family permease